MRSWIVRSQGLEPRFRNAANKKWSDGDLITEEDLLGIYRPDHIETLIASGALEELAASPETPEDGVAEDASEATAEAATEPTDPEPEARPRQKKPPAKEE